jgi:hypothetical protein
VIVVSLTTEKGAVVPPNVTDEANAKPDPWIVTDMPPAVVADAGASELTSGCGATQANEGPEALVPPAVVTAT